MKTFILGIALGFVIGYVVILGILKTIKKI